jgi:predicted nucleic acid-binding Zn ribbon protein
MRRIGDPRPGGRKGPRKLSEALGVVREGTAPATPLAAAQGAWAEAAGPAVAAQAEPVSERGGVLTVACRSATWAHELDLLGPELLERLNAALAAAGVPPIERLRFTADAARHDRG